DVEVSSVISTLLSGPAVALRKTKNAINTATLVEWEAALEREKQGQLVLIDSNDFREGTRAFQQRRAAKFTDSRRTLRERPRLHGDTPRTCVRERSLAEVEVPKIGGLWTGRSAT